MRTCTYTLPRGICIHVRKNISLKAISDEIETKLFQIPPRIEIQLRFTSDSLDARLFTVAIQSHHTFSDVVPVRQSLILLPMYSRSCQKSKSIILDDCSCAGFKIIGIKSQCLVKLPAECKIWSLCDCFCMDVRIPYVMFTFTRGNQEVISRLAEVAEQLRMMEECRKVAAKD